MNILADYIFSDHMRYEAHQLVYVPQDASGEPIVLTGILGATVLTALLADTDEGNARGITVDTDEERQAWMARYEREVRRDDWGYLYAEVQQLNESYVQLLSGDICLTDLCPNVRLHDLALQLLVSYMNHLVQETFCEHIWEIVPWRTPFAQWLLDATQMESRRQRFLQTDWTQPQQVNLLTDIQSQILPRLWAFEGEIAADIMSRYFQWRCEQYVSAKQEQPGAKITRADSNYIYKQETDTAPLLNQINLLLPDELKEWERWMEEWNKFLTARLKPQQDIRFWEKDVPENVREHLLYRLRQQERQKAHFRKLALSIHAMRYLGFIRRKLSDKAMREWLSENLNIDYTARNNASQFQRAMKEYGRYSPEVRDEILYLHNLGYFRFNPAPAAT